MSMPGEVKPPPTLKKNSPPPECDYAAENAALLSEEDDFLPGPDLFFPDHRGLQVARMECDIEVERI